MLGAGRADRPGRRFPGGGAGRGAREERTMDSRLAPVTKALARAAAAAQIGAAAARTAWAGSWPAGPEPRRVSALPMHAGVGRGERRSPRASGTGASCTRGGRTAGAAAPSPSTTRGGRAPRRPGMRLAARRGRRRIVRMPRRSGPGPLPPTRQHATQRISCHTRYPTQSDPNRDTRPATEPTTGHPTPGHRARTQTPSRLGELEYGGMAPGARATREPRRG